MHRLSEIEIEGVGIMRPCNIYQINRIQKIRSRADRDLAWPAFELGMTIRQFKKLPADLQKQAMAAHFRLTDPDALSPRREPQQPAPPAPGQHVPVERQIELGRRLLEMKARLPRGHFMPWVERDSGVTYAQAQRWMKAARHAGVLLA